jgi:hypothetical protein
MDIDFAELELLAQHPIEFESGEWLKLAAQQYETSAIQELFELLESAVESYTLVRADLATGLRESAEKEIEFFLSLLQERLKALLDPLKTRLVTAQIQVA